MGSLSRLVLPQHEQFYPDVLSVFVGLDKVSTEIQGLSSTYCNFQGLSRPWISFIKFKDFQGACEPWENLVLHFSRSLFRLVTPKTRHFTYHYWVKLNTTLLRIFLLRWCYTGRFATTIFVQHRAAMLEHYCKGLIRNNVATMLRWYVALKIVDVNRPV